METKTIGNTKIIYQKTQIKIFVEDLNQPFFRELQHIGAVFNPIEYMFLLRKSVSNQFLESIINFYNSPYQNMTKGQRNFRDSLIKKLGNPDLTIERYGENLVLTDLNQLGGTTKEIKSDLQKIGIEIKTIINETRIYIPINIIGKIKI
jgi:hypothetical protein